MYIKPIQLGNLRIDANNIKAVVEIPEATIKVPEGYTGEPKKVFKVTIILHQPIRPKFGYDLNLYEDTARAFLKWYEPDIIDGTSNVLPFNDYDYAKSIYEKAADQETSTSESPEQNGTALQIGGQKLLVLAVGTISGPQTVSDIIHVPEENDQ